MKKLLIYAVLVASLALALVGIQPTTAQVMTGSLTTTFVGGNGCFGNMFDVTAIGTDDITITGFDQNTYLEAVLGPPSGPADVYYKAGSYVGFESTPGAWTFAGTDTITQNPIGVPVPINVGGITIPAGQTYGIYIDTGAIPISYNNGSNTYATSELQIDTGTGLCGNFSGLNPGRNWNGTIYYEYGTAVVTALNVPHVTDIRINSWQQVVAYDSPAGSPAKLLSGAVIVLPQDYNGDGYDTYVVTDTAVVDGVTWYSIFLGNESFVWVNGSEVILQ